MEDSMKEKVLEMLEKVRPSLQADGGDVPGLIETTKRRGASVLKLGAECTGS